MGFLSDLLGYKSFDPWQIELMDKLRRGVRRITIASANGTGKTYLLSGLELWWLLTKADATISVCSATFPQLFDAHFRLIRYHIDHSIIKDFFDVGNQTKIRLPNSFDAAYIAAVGNNKSKPEAIQGRHHGSLLTVFDEASGIFGEIYDAQEGNMTTDGATWICIGNPLKSGTPFHSLFSRDDWEKMHIDGRTCKWVNQEWVARMIGEYGEEDDRVRARVMGQFPKGSVNTIIGEDTYDIAEQRPLQPTTSGIIIGLDVSRSGSDAAVICSRQGRNLVDIQEVKSRRDSMYLAQEAVAYFKKWNASIISIDSGGMGGPICDIIRHMLPIGSVHECNFGGAIKNPIRYVNHKAELWDSYNDWLKLAHLPVCKKLREDSLIVEGWTTDGGKFQVESKDTLRDRYGSSSDWVDAVLCSLDIDSDLKKTERPRRREVAGYSWA